MRPNNRCYSSRHPPHPLTIHFVHSSNIRFAEVLTCSFFGFTGHFIDYGALVVASSPPRAPGSGQRRSYESSSVSSKSIFGEFQHFGSPLFHEAASTATEYLRQPDVFVADPVASHSATHSIRSPSLSSPLNLKRKMGLSPMFRGPKAEENQ